MSSRPLAMMLAAAAMLLVGLLMIQFGYGIIVSAEDVALAEDVSRGLSGLFGALGYLSAIAGSIAALGGGLLMLLGYNRWRHPEG